MKQISLFAASLCALIAFTGCDTLKQFGQKAPAQASKPAAVQQAAAPAAAANKPFEGEWAIVEVNGNAVSINGEDHPKISFEAIPGSAADVAVIGFNGCNYLNGTWSIAGKNIAKQGEFLSSLRSCADAPYETVINVALDGVASYVKPDGRNMSLLNAAGQPVMKLRKIATSFLNGAWAVTAINGQPVPQTAEIKIVIDTDECRVHGNAGCNMLNGAIVVNLDKPDAIEFKDLSTTRMTCPDIATEQSFLLALESVDTAVKGANANEAVLKDRSGNAVLTLRRLAPGEIAE